MAETTQIDSSSQNIDTTIEIDGDDTLLEHRFADRRMSQKPALIRLAANMLGDEGPPVPCIIRDSSISGARISLTGPDAKRWASTGLPDRLTLFIPVDYVETDCRVIWQNGNEYGLTYISPTRVLKRPPKRKFDRPANESIARRMFGKRI